MKSLKQIRTALVEASHEDTEAHFVAPTAAQASIMNKSQLKVDEEGGDREIGPGTQLRTSDGAYCVVDKIDDQSANSEYAWCTDEDGQEIHVNLSTADVIRSRPPLRDEKNFYKKDEYKDDLRKLRDMYDKLDEDEATPPPTEAGQSTVKKVKEALNLEKDPVEKWITDYTKSTDPRFKGMDKSSRIKIALSDFGAAQKATGKKPVQESHLDGGHEAEEISMTRNELDEIADMADDLFSVLPNFDECPAWIQHKIAGIHASIHGIYDYYRRKSTERQEAAYACDSGTEPDAIRIAVASPVNPVPTELPVPPAKM
jgi:hypothetical protein